MAKASATPPVKVGDLIKNSVSLPLAKGGYHKMEIVGEITSVNGGMAEYKTVKVLSDENNPGTSVIEGGTLILSFFGRFATLYTGEI